MSEVVIQYEPNPAGTACTVNAVGDMARLVVRRRSPGASVEEWLGPNAYLAEIPGLIDALSEAERQGSEGRSGHLKVEI